MGVIQCDLDGNITSMNPAAREMLSSSVEEAIHVLPLGETTAVHIPGEPQIFRISHQSFPDRGFQHPFFLIESLTSEVRLAEKAAYERVIRMIAHEVNNSVAGIIGSLTGDEAERLTALSAFVTRFAEVVKIPQPQLQLCDLSEVSSKICVRRQMSKLTSISLTKLYQFIWTPSFSSRCLSTSSRMP